MDRLVADGLKAIRRIVIGVIGGTVLLFGLALLVLPGPAFVVIPIGLGILALEFQWARRWLRRARALAESGTGRGRDRTGGGPPEQGREPPESAREPSGSAPPNAKPRSPNGAPAEPLPGADRSGSEAPEEER